MADRKACREATWHYPGWNDIVANTVPLVNTMSTRCGLLFSHVMEPLMILIISTRILEPMEFSPTQ